MGEYHQKWYLKNKKKIDARQREYYKENRTRVRARHKEHYLANKEAYAGGQKRRRSISPAIFKWRSLSQRCKKGKFPLLMTQGEFVEWADRQPQHCTYCGLVDLSLDDSPPGKRGCILKFFTIDRRDPELPYVAGNLALACWRCNRLKNNFFTYQEFMEIAAKYIRPRWMKKLEVFRDVG